MKPCTAISKSNWSKSNIKRIFVRNKKQENNKNKPKQTKLCVDSCSPKMSIYQSPKPWIPYFMWLRNFENDIKRRIWIRGDHPGLFGGLNIITKVFLTREKVRQNTEGLRRRWKPRTERRDIWRCCVTGFLSLVNCQFISLKKKKDKWRDHSQGNSDSLWRLQKTDTPLDLPEET